MRILLYQGCLILLLCAMLCSLRVHLSLRGTDMYTHDVFVPIDGAWRMLWGQRPHFDFYSPFGVGTFVPTLVGLMLSAGKVKAFSLGQGIAGFVLAVWAFLLGRRRLTVWPLALFCLLVVLTALGISNMGMPTFSFTPGMTYNRQCYALVMLIMIEALVPPVDSFNGGWAGGVSTGIALALLLFTKITFFLGAAALVVSLSPYRFSRERLLGILGGIGAPCLAIAAYFSFDLRPMFQDLAIAARAKHISLRVYRFDHILQDAATCIALGFGAWVALRDRSLAIAGVLVAILGTAFILTSYEPDGFPLLAPLGVVVLSRIRDDRRPSILFLAICAGTPGVVDAGNYSAGLLAACARNTAGFGVMPEEKMAGFVSSDAGYLDFVEDGVKLIAQHRSAEDTVLSLDFSNPFPFVMGLHPMQGGVVNQQAHTTFSEKSFPPAERVFGTATLVMMPKEFTDKSLDGTVEEIYGPFLHGHFSRAGESKFWVLYRKNAADPLKSDSAPG